MPGKKKNSKNKTNHYILLQQRDRDRDSDGAQLVTIFNANLVMCVRCCCSSRPTAVSVAVTGPSAATTGEKYVVFHIIIIIIIRISITVVRTRDTSENWVHRYPITLLSIGDAIIIAINDKNTTANFFFEHDHHYFFVYHTYIVYKL